MKTILLSIHKEQTKQPAVREQLRRAGDIIRRGGLVAFPTETVYGLGADAFNAEAAEKIYAAKGRPSDNPLIVHIAETDALYRLASAVPEEALRLADAFWPGPMTLILPKCADVPDRTTGGLQTVAVRFPSHPVAQALIAAAGGFVAAPSANVSGRPSPTKAAHCIEDLDGRVEMIIDGGDCEIGLESTIIDLTGARAEILRPGFVTEEEIAAVLDGGSGAGGENKGSGSAFPGHSRRPDDRNGETGGKEGAGGAGGTGGHMPQGAHPRAPGMKYRHYAPRGELYVVVGERQNVVEYICDALKRCREAGTKTGVFCFDADMAAYSGADLCLAAGAGDHETYAARLFDALRRMDAAGAETIYAEAPSGDGVGTAVWNRLEKASGGKVIFTDPGEETMGEGKTVIMDHPLIRHKIGYIRRTTTGTKDFRETISEIAMLICYEATRGLELQDVEIETPICKTTVQELKGRKLCVVPILRAGLGMVDGILQLVPAAKVGHIGLYRDPDSLEPVEYYCKLPPDCGEREIFVVDPMLATGGSVTAAISMLKARGCVHIHMMCIIAAPEGLERLRREHPEVNVYIGAMDERLNDHGYIVPGLGDAGDRIFGTK